MSKKLKVGDRVVVRHCVGAIEDFEGQRGTITRPDKDEAGMWWVLLDNTDHAVWFRATEITKAKKAPKGPEAYKGNGKHEWKPVTAGTQRLRVPGGWLYSIVDGLGARRDVTFVPAPEVIGYEI